MTSSGDCDQLGCADGAIFEAFAGGGTEGVTPVRFCAAHLADFCGAPKPWGAAGPVGATTLVRRVA